MKVYHDNAYLDLVDRVIKNGVSKEDRTGTGTIGLFAQQMRFDLSNYSIPMLTTKKMHIRSIIYEILWYLNGDTNTKYLVDNGVRIWNEWSSAEGHLNKIYGFQWRKWEVSDWESNVVEIPIYAGGQDFPFVPPTIATLPIEYTPDDTFVGRGMQTKFGDYFTVTSTSITQESHTYTIQFVKTNFVMTINSSQLGSSIIDIDDPYRPSIFGQGCVGVYAEETNIRELAFDLWIDMMEKCYNITHPDYEQYGGAGMFVDQEWRCFSNFLRDLHDVVYFSRWREAPDNYTFDPSYFGANVYSKKSCVFLPREYGEILAKLNGCKYVAHKLSTNKETEFTISERFVNTNNIPHGQITSSMLSDSDGITIDGWVIEKINPKAGHVYRQQIFVDQISDVIHKIKHNPTDRRMVVSAWNVGQIPDMALPPCHAMFQFWTDGVGGLSCHLYQRSMDVGLGCPFNIVQYSILTHMVAQVTGLTATELVHTSGDCHIYTNHIDQLKEQLTRIPFASPTLKLNKSVTDIDDFGFEDFEIIGYECHPSIKMDVAV